MIALLVALALGGAADLPDVRNEQIHLDRAELRIDQPAFETGLRIAIERPVAVSAGVALSASGIHVTLRQIRGDGRFHADFSRLRRVFASHNLRTSSTKENP